MKKTILYMGILLLAVACKNKQAAEVPASETVLAEADYPYTLKKPYKNWQAGDQKNALVVLKMLKAWETRNVAECASYFADTTEMNFDGYHSIMSHDSITPFLESSLADYASVKIEMQDWESVVSADKMDEWVTVWYKQSWVDKKGVADSLNIIDDAKIVNGKITVFDEYIQHFPNTKK